MLNSEVFKRNQAELPEEERMADSHKDMCLHTYDGWRCTSKYGHKGPHIAHGITGTVCARWAS